MRFVRASSVLLVALPVPAAAADICTTVARIVAASRETPAFSTLAGALERGEAVIPEFAPENCRATPGLEIGCGSMTMNRQLGEWAAMRDCPGAVLQPPAPVPAGRRRRIADFRETYIVSGVRISFGIGCMPCAGPATQYFSATLAGREPPAD